MYLKELCWHKPSLFFWFGAFCDVLHDKAWIQKDCVCNWKVRFSCLYTNMKQLLLEAHLSQCPCVTMVTQPRDLKDGAGRASVNRLALQFWTWKMAQDVRLWTRLALQFWTWKTAGETRAEAGCAEIPGRAAPFILGFLIWGFKYKLLSEEPDSQNANTASSLHSQTDSSSAGAWFYRNPGLAGASSPGFSLSLQNQRCLSSEQHGLHSPDFPSPNPRTLSALVWAAVTKYHRPNGLSNRCWFPAVPEASHPRPLCWRRFWWFTEGHLLALSSRGGEREKEEKKQALWRVLLQGH